MRQLTPPPPPTTPPGPPRAATPDPAAEDGSLVTEYGLLAVLGATIVGIAIRWAGGGAIFELLSALLGKVRVLVGA